MHEAWCYSSLGDKKIRCNLCIIGCTIGEGQLGLCQTRENVSGRLFNTVYSHLTSFSTDFVEKIPLYHFHPNQRFLTIGGAGCNLSCKFCLTWNITQKPLAEIDTEYLPPEKLVNSALELGCGGLAYTHSEPSLNIEFFSEVMEIAKKSGLVNVFATNGFLSLEAFDRIANLVDAVALTFKGGEDFYRKVCGARYDKEHFKKLIENIKRVGIHLELVYVLIPGVNDDDESLSEVMGIAKAADAPLIFLRFFPSYKMEDIDSTPEGTLERAINLAYTRGVDYVYMENIFQHPGKNTYCPACKTILIEREGYGIVDWRVVDGRCPGCGKVVPIVGKPPQSVSASG
jgi:pyruvate formate lyase activating enzyme